MKWSHKYDNQNVRIIYPVSFRINVSYEDRNAFTYTAHQKKKKIKMRKKEGTLKERRERKIIFSFTIRIFYPNEKMKIYQEGK